MRIVAVLGVGLLALAACSKPEEKAASADAAGASASASAPAGPLAAPKRKPGLWLQTMTSTAGSQETKLCLDEATEAKMTVWGQAASKDICAKNEITPAAGGWRIESECDFGEAGKNVTTGTISGDFNTKYVLKMTTTTTGAKTLQMNGTQEMEMTGVWQGACPAGMKAGDMTLPGGAKININDVAALGGK